MLLPELWAANQTLHQTPDTWAVPAGAGGGVGELVVSLKRITDGKTRYNQNKVANAARGTWCRQ
jgi:hypothetical protein